MSKFRRKFKWKNILSFVLVGVLLVASVAGLGAVFNRDTKTISSTAFAVGGINEKGNYVESKTSIYTKDMFECQGLSIEPDFEATGTYKVFYYNANKNFIGATDELKAEDGVYTKGDTFAVARYARIMITPDIPTDEDGVEEAEFKIRFYEVTGYASDYKISVDKKQNAEKVNVFVVDKDMLGKVYSASEGSTPTVMEGSDYETFGATKPVDVTGASEITLEYKKVNSIGIYTYFFLDANGVVIQRNNLEGSKDTTSIVVPNGACQFVASYVQGNEFNIYIK